MAPVDSLPDELLEKIAGLLVPSFSTSAPSPLKRNMFSLDKTKTNRLSAKPVLDGPKRVSIVTTASSPSRSSTDYGDLNNLARNLTLRVTEVTHTHEQLLKVVRGPTGAFIRAVSIRDPDPVVHPRIITPNYRNNMIFAFSNFLVHFPDALSEHSTLECFHWNVFDTLKFTLDQGRVIPVGIYSNLRKFVYRAHMLSCTSNCVYERRTSRLLYLSFENLRFLQLQNVNLAVCFEFRSSYYAPSSIESTAASAPVTASTSDRLTPLVVHSSMIPASASSNSLLLSRSHLSSENHAQPLSVSSPTSPASNTSPASPAGSRGSLFSPASSAPSSPLKSTTLIQPRTGVPRQLTDSSRSTSTPSVFFVSPPLPAPHKPILFPNLETACFTDIFTASSVSSFTCEWLIDLLNDHRCNKDLTIKYASRCVGTDAIFAREWGLLVPDPDAVGLNGQKLSDEESFRRAGWGGGVKSGIWKAWNWEYSTIKGWSMTTTIGRIYKIY
ncbi:hypothetical protein V1515DRAFT_636574 [Lipomyces mesembrius]